MQIAEKVLNIISDRAQNGRKDKPEWIKRIIAMSWKTLAVCDTCHLLIHSGKYQGKKIADL